MGFLVPFNAKYSLFDGNDFSNNLVVKLLLENKDSKTAYPYYILSKTDFSVERISSSSMNLGLSMELLKKYIIKLNLLIRTNKDNYLNLFDKYSNYLEDQKKIMWVYPDLIYPHNDIIKNKEKDMQISDLIKYSNKKIFFLKIIEMKYKEKEILGFVFKLTEINQKNKNKKINFQNFLPNSKNEIIFDLLNLKYIRTITVKEKSGLKNLREKNEDDFNIYSDKRVKSEKNKKKRKNDIINESSSENDDKLHVIINKEKLLELQTKDSNDIKIFINLLPFYGNDVSLIKQRPNKEKYATGKAQEPLIKIDVNKVIKRIDLKLRDNPQLYKKIKNQQTQNKNKENKNISMIKNEFYSSNINQNEINNKENERINKDFIYNNNNNSIYLKNLFNYKSLQIIKFVDYLIYLFINIIVIAEFALTYISLISHKKKFLYLNDSYQLLNDFVGIKYYLMEGILPNYFPQYIDLNFVIDEEDYYDEVKNYIEEYRQDFANRYSNLSNPSVKFSNEYYNFISKTNLSLLTLSNGYEKREEEPFHSAVNRLSNAIFYISTSIDYNDFNLNNKYVYELMTNLLQVYYLPFQHISFLIYNDFKNTIKNYTFYIIIIFIFSLVTSLLYTIIYWKIMNQLGQDREKPINLFLTIKKQIFENLKISSENFSNKLLNNYFGNEENEEESKQQYKTKVSPTDINVAKFKALNDYKSSINKNNSFTFYLIQLIIFFIIYNIVLILKYFINKYYYYNIEEYLRVYNFTQFSRIYLLGRVNVAKQFFFNESLSIFGNYYEFNDELFIENFLTITEEFEGAIKETSKTKYFLKKGYTKLFTNSVFSNFTEMILYNLNENEKLVYKAYFDLISSVEIGFKYISMQIYEIFRIISLKYMIDNKRNELIQNISDLLNDDSWKYIYLLYFYVGKPWYTNIIEIINSHYFKYIERLKSKYLIVFIIVMILINLNFWIIWKRFENNYIDSIKKSFDLINLIPEEIKYIIVSKLNE